MTTKRISLSLSLSLSLHPPSLSPPPSFHSDLEFALTLSIDWVALSFVQKPEDIMELRALAGPRVKVSEDEDWMGMEIGIGMGIVYNLYSTICCTGLCCTVLLSTLYFIPLHSLFIYHIRPHFLLTFNLLLIFLPLFCLFLLFSLPLSILFFAWCSSWPSWRNHLQLII